MSFDYDLFVIGGGSGGVRAARIAAGHGARVALAEESRMGGTCVIRGCVPKKLMIFASEAPHLAAEARAYGWAEAQSGAFGWADFRAKLDAELNRLEGLYTSGLESAGVSIYPKRARLSGPHEVTLADGVTVSAKHILIAVGGRPQRPGIEGDEHGLVSDDLFTLDHLPRRVLVMGGGFIACEFATILAGLGADVTLSYRGDAVLRGFDSDGRADIGAQLAMMGVDLRLSHRPVKLEKGRDGVMTVTLDDGTQGEYDAVMFATGRVPNTSGLGLEPLGVELGARGEIKVDAWSQTAVPSIYAVGDVTDRINLTPVAIREGHAFADTVFGAMPRKVDHSLVGSAVYTRPFELASIGITEDDARARADTGESFDIYESRFRPMRSLFAGSDLRARFKLIVSCKDQMVVGCHLFAPEAGEMIQLVAVAMGMGARKADFDQAIAVHPTLAEELVTMRVPARQIGAT